MKQQVDNNFKYHAPKDGQPQRYTETRGMGKAFAEAIDSLCPNSREKSVAMTKIEEAVMWLTLRLRGMSR